LLGCIGFAYRIDEIYRIDTSIDAAYSEDIAFSRSFTMFVQPANHPLIESWTAVLAALAEAF